MESQLARASAALAVPSAAPPSRGAGSVVAMPAGQIAGDVRALEISADGRSVTYELLVANETGAPLATFAYPAGVRRPGELVSWSAISVPPRSSIALEIDVATPRGAAPRRLVAELHAPGGYLRLDGETPALHPRGRARRAAIAAVAAMLLAAGGAAYAAGRPRVAALAAPERVQAGTAFSVAYALGPLDAGTYDVERPDGTVVGEGHLTGSDGAFVVALPSGRAASGYDVRVTARNHFGETVRVAHVLALGEPAPARAPSAHVRREAPPVHVSDVALAHDVVRGGDPIVVNYATDGSAGDVRLIDQDGTVRGEALTNPHGNSIVIAPHVTADQDFRVVVTAARGTAHAESEVPVRVEADASEAASRTTQRPAHAGAEGPIFVGASDVASGDAVDVAILRHERELHVSLVAPNGETLEGADVPDNRSAIALPAPEVVAPSKFLIVATFARGYGQETVVREIVVRPRPAR